MNARSQEREDEIKYLDLSEGEESRIYIAAPTETRPWTWRDRAGVLVVMLIAWALVLALVLGMRDEWHIIGRIFPVTLGDIVERFKGFKILVAGDPMVDVYHFGRVERVSQEAPVPVFVEERVDKRFGGAANVWHQLAELGCDARAGYSLDSTTWTEKHRYLVGSHQLFRVDFDRTVERAGYIDYGVAAVVVSDYGKGAVTRESMASAIDGGQPTIVDPKGEDWDKYLGATVMCPNTEEWNDYIRSAPPTRPIFPTVIVKRGPAGLELLRHDGPNRLLPAQAKHVFDVTGAGDTVTAVVAATIAAAGSIDQACELANLAAGYVVGEVGTTVCPLATLKALLP